MTRPVFQTPLASAVFTVVGLIVLLLAHGTAFAADLNKLRDGTSVLQGMRRDKSPELNKFLDGVVNDKLPSPAPGSGLTPVDGNTDPSVLNDPKNVFVKNQDGSVSYISKQRLQEPMCATAAATRSGTATRPVA